MGNTEMIRSKTAKRKHCVSVRLSPEELNLIDTVRGGFQRGVAIRLLALSALPAPIPEVNRTLYIDLGRALGNISSLASASRKGGFVAEQDLLPALHELRILLIRGKSHMSTTGEDE
jgi:hypothetical protein